MIGTRFHVHMNDGESHECVVTPRVAVSFERHFKLGNRKAFKPDEERTEYSYWLAWECLRTTGRTVPMFDTWLNDVSHLSFGEPEADPKSPTR